MMTSSAAVQQARRVTIHTRESTPAGRNIPLGYLRAFVTLLVVAHHAFLAYHPYAPPQVQSLRESPWWAAFPIVDARRWAGIEAFVGFNDVFFMSLMFLISGMFVPSSLLRKGAAGFLRDRAWKLGLPFVAGAAVLAPLAYYATYLAGARQEGFWSQWFSLGFWPAGPVWFLWVLIAFGAVAAVLQKIKPEWSSALGRVSGGLSARPVVYLAALVAISAMAYMPMAITFTAERWFSFGPFSVQSSRVFHYLVYFLAGVGLGAFGLEKGLLSGDGKLARRWYVWVVSAVVAFGFVAASVIAVVTSLTKGGPGKGLLVFASFAFVLSCACSSMAFLALFLRFARKANRVFDSLSSNAYGIYLFHYFCVSWLQLSLLKADLPASAKALLVLSGAVLVSWMFTAGLRRVPGVGRVL